MKYSRWIVRHEGWRHTIPDLHPRIVDCGIFTVLEGFSDLSKKDRRRLHRVYKWFNDNIDCPPWSKKKSLLRGICWWRTEAILDSPILKKMQKLVEITSGYDELMVKLIVTENPGKVIYKDDLQIVAEPKKGMRVVTQYEGPSCHFCRLAGDPVYRNFRLG